MHGGTDRSKLPSGHEELVSKKKKKKVDTKKAIFVQQEPRRSNAQPGRKLDFGYGQEMHNQGLWWVFPKELLGNCELDISRNLLVRFRMYPH